MCGIAGLLSKKTLTIGGTHEEIVKNILDQQSYRGPDHRGMEEIITPQHRLVLGHNRLSIIGLGEDGNQPMWDSSRRYCIVYNGMLYNYQELQRELKQLGHEFKTQTDTEVFLTAFKQWGVYAFRRFNGMFAAAIFDTQEEKLYLVRDRFGVKPLYYCQQNNILYFASTSNELSSALKLKPNLNSVAIGLRYWCYEYNNQTLYHELAMVAPSEVLTFHFEGQWRMTSHKYYSLEDQVTSLIKTLSSNKLINLQEAIESVLHDAIKIRLRSDVPLGVSLSGGLDSATIAAIAKTNLPHLTAFNFGSRAHSHTEGKQAALIAQRSGLTLNYVFPTPHEVHPAFWKTLSLQDAPFPNLSIVAQYLVFQKAKEHGIKVMLGGQGGDEIFMGYRKFHLFYLQYLMSQKKQGISILFLLSMIPTLVRELPQFTHHLFNLKRYKKSSNPFSRWNNYMEPLNLGLIPGEQLWQRQIRDIYDFSLPALLRYEDRNSMGNSIESRLPFLDYRLVELALALPEVAKLNKGFGKWILREIASDYIPKQICFARNKRGFDMYSTPALKAGLGSLMRERIKSNSTLLHNLNLSNKVDKIFSDRSLCHDKNSLAEAIALTWLSQKM